MRRLTHLQNLLWTTALGLGFWTAAGALAPAAGLDLVLRVDPAQVRLWQGGQLLLDATRPEAARRLSLRFYEDGIRFQTSRQRLAWAWQEEPVRRLLLPQPLDGTWDRPAGAWRAQGSAELLLDAAVPAAALYHLRVDAPEDFSLTLGDADLNGVSLVLRPLGNEKGWCQRVQGRFGLFRGYTPLGPLSAWVARAALSEALAWLGAALLCAGLLLGLSLLLGRLPAGPRVPLRPGRGGFAWALALGFGLALASLLLGGQGLAHVTDEISTLFQARILAVGRSVAPLPPRPAAFFMEHILTDAAGWHSKYPPLWAALLSPWAARGWEWLAGPFYGALAIAVAYAWAREAAGRAEALALAGLLALSPQFVWLSGSYFNHAPSLAASLVLLWGLWRARERARAGGWLLAAAGGALLAAMRPYSAACLGLAGGVWALGAGGWRRRDVWSGLAGVALAMAAAVLLSNAIGTGSPWTSSYALYDAQDHPGFGSGLGSLPTWGSWGHDPLKGLASVLQGLRDLRWRLLGWPAGLSGGLLLVALLSLRWDRLERLLALSFAALLLGHAFYWASILLNLGTCYWFEALACLVWLALRGLGALAERWRGAGLPRARAAAGLLLAVGALCSTAWLLPRQAWTLRSFAKVDLALDATVAPLGPALRGLVFVPVVEPFDYNGAFIHNSPFLDGRFVFARALSGPEDAALAALFPSRRPLRLERGVLRPYRPGTRP